MECGQDLRQAQERIPILDVDVIISACKLALEGIVSKRKDSVYHSGSSPVGGGGSCDPAIYPLQACHVLHVATNLKE